MNELTVSDIVGRVRATFDRSELIQAVRSVRADALVRDVRCLENCVVGPGAALLDWGQVVSDPGTAFGNGAGLPIGIETGGRPVPVYAELDVEVAAAVARLCGREGLREAYAS